MSKIFFHNGPMRVTRIGPNQFTDRLLSAAADKVTSVPKAVKAFIANSPNVADRSKNDVAYHLMIHATLIHLFPKNIGDIRILKVGDRTGAYPFYLNKEHGTDARLLDVTGSIVAYARQNGLAADAGEPTAMPYRDGEFDAVVTLNFLEDSDPKTISEIFRVLKTGGRYFSYLDASIKPQTMENSGFSSALTLAFIEKLTPVYVFTK
jgi:SAM-dependent methyltransferase